MTQKPRVYICEFCGNTVEMLHVGDGKLVCCGQPLTLLEGEENTAVCRHERHIPLVEKFRMASRKVRSVAQKSLR